MAQIEQERISALDSLVTQSADGVNELIESTAEAAKWAMAVDYVVPDDTTVDPAELVDRGTKRIPVNRIGLLTESRLIPQSMLPHRMENILDGKMECTNPGTVNEKWIFTASGTGKKYVCPGPPGTGESRPDINTIYRDESRDGQGDNKPIYTQYRYVPLDNEYVGTQDETGNFVSIPSDLVMINGDGTEVNDDLVNYTRKIDLRIGTPAPEVVSQGEQPKSIFINQSHELVHASTGASGTWPYSPQPQSVAFGSTIYVPQLTVNATGHVSGAAQQSITIPNTAATSGSTPTPGLVKIGIDIQSISDNNSAGSVPGPGEYFAVAAADHKHKASELRLENVNTGNGTISYNGASSQTQTYSFNNILKATLPSTPTAANQFLVGNPPVSGEQYGHASWANPESFIKPDYIMIDVSVSSLGSSVTPITMSSSSYVHGEGPLTATQAYFSGLKPDKAYVVCYYFAFDRSNALSTMESVTVSVSTGATTSAWDIANTAQYVLDGSIAGLMPNYINGSAIIRVPSEISYANISSAYARITLSKPLTDLWSMTGNVQIAEVK